MIKHIVIDSDNSYIEDSIIANLNKKTSSEIYTVSRHTYQNKVRSTNKNKISETIFVSLQNNNQNSIVTRFGSLKSDRLANSLHHYLEPCLPNLNLMLHYLDEKGKDKHIYVLKNIYCSGAIVRYKDNDIMNDLGKCISKGIISYVE